MDQPTFHALYQHTPRGFKAELVGGIVFVASPVSVRHGKPHSRLGFWLELYESETPGTQTLVDTTIILDEENEPQPDLALRIEPTFGGQTRDENDDLFGPCELVVEIANSSFALDTHAKKQTYEMAGVLEYLIVLVKSQSVIWYTREASRFVEIQPDTDGVYRSHTFPGLWLDPSSIFDPTSQRLRATLEQGLTTPEHAAFVASLATRHATWTQPNLPQTGEPQ